METVKIAVPAARSDQRRRQLHEAAEGVRYFLAKPGTSSTEPELGQEVASEGEALVEAFKAGQLFYTVIGWHASPETSGNEVRIVKRLLPHNSGGAARRHEFQNGPDAVHE